MESVPLHSDTVQPLTREQSRWALHKIKIMNSSKIHLKQTKYFIEYRHNTICQQTDMKDSDKKHQVKKIILINYYLY